MGSFPFFLKEAVAALRRNAAPSMAAVVTIAVTVLLVGVLIPVVFFARDKTSDVRDQLGLEVFLTTNASRDDIASIKQKLTSTPHIEDISFVSRKAAIESVPEEFTDSLGQKNPLPASFFVKPDDPDNIEAILSLLSPVGAAGVPIPFSKAVDEISAARDASTKIRDVTSGLQTWLIVIVVMLTLTSLLLVGNTIRLSIYARRRDIEVMRLVGATGWFIRWPFVIEGVLVGLFGAMIASFFLWLGWITVAKPSAENFSFLSDFSAPSFQLEMLELIVGSIAVAALGSGVTLRRFLRV